MASWACNASSNDALVAKLRRTGVIQSNAVVQAMLATDRAKYVAQYETPDREHVGALPANQDVPHPMGFHPTISAPHMHGHALELGYVTSKDVATPYVLDVGCGSGYLTACLGHLVADKGGRVVGQDLVPALVPFARKNIHAANGALLERGSVTLRCHNGWDGLPNEAPFHSIHVGAAAEVPPQALINLVVRNLFHRVDFPQSLYTPAPFETRSAIISFVFGNFPQGCSREPSN